MNKEFICMYSDVFSLEEQINKWIKEGYKIEIISQSVTANPYGEEFNYVVTSLWKWKEND